jgi:urease accessory protein
MIATAGATIQADGRVSRLSGRPPLTLRQVHGDVATLCLVGAAAGPLSGDDLSVCLDLKPGSQGRLVSTGATLAQGRGGQRQPGRMRTAVTVGAGGSLVATPPPLVACAGSQTEVAVTIDLDETASLQWRELVVLGRSDEPAGSLRLDWNVRRGGNPLLRQTIDLTDPRHASWSGMLHGQKVIVTELIVGSPLGTRHTARTVVLSPLAVAQQLDDRSTLLTVLSGDAASADATLAELRSTLTANDRC